MNKSVSDQTTALVWSCRLLGLSQTDRSRETLKQRLADYIDHLIAHDFRRLISILYRIDVSQHKAEKAIASAWTEHSPGMNLAELIINRQAQKLWFRGNYK